MRTSFIMIMFLFVLAMNARGQIRHNVYFGTDEYRLTAAARSQLDTLLYDSFQKIDGRKVLLRGHCDARGSLQYNDSLSAWRIQYVKTYLIESGRVDANKITIAPRGEREPLNKNRAEEEWQLNRRVEVIFGDDTTAVSLEEQIKKPTVTAGSNIVLKNINFYGGRRHWLPGSKPIVDELLQTMKAIPTLVIEIQGHICCQPGDNDGLDIETRINNLSMVRAENIHNYLLANGIEAKRVSWRGLGHSQPIYPYPENSEEERIANRRVEIKIISK